MAIPSLFVASLAIVGANQVAASCDGTITNIPGLTLQFTPSLPAQVAPLSTVYGAIVTNYLNVVDCKYVHVENVDNNPAKIGQFYQKTTLPVLTVHRVGCMPETTAVTRRDLRGFEETDVLQQATSATVGSVQSGGDVALERYDLTQLLSSLTASQSDLSKPYGNLTVTQGEWIQQINTAVWALNVAFSGMNLTEVCNSLQDERTFLALTEADFDASEARNLICFISEYGISLSESLTEILRDLDWLAYAIGSSDRSVTVRVCTTIEVDELSLFGVDVNAIFQAICGYSISSTITNITQGPTPTLGWNASNATIYETLAPTGTLSLPWTIEANHTTTVASHSPWYKNASTSTITPLMATTMTLISSTVSQTTSVNTFHSSTAPPWHYVARKRLRHNLL